jgi:transposase-like protein
MRQKSGPDKAPAEDAIRDIRRATRRHFSAEDKIRIVLEGLRGEDSIAELCRREGIAFWAKGAVGEIGLGAEEDEPAGLVQRDQSSQKQTTEERAQHADRQQEGWARRYPPPPVERYAAARHDHVDMRMMRYRRRRRGRQARNTANVCIECPHPSLSTLTPASDSVGVLYLIQLRNSKNVIRRKFDHMS